jgi:hypothetical protein
MVGADLARGRDENGAITETQPENPSIRKAATESPWHSPNSSDRQLSSSKRTCRPARLCSRKIRTELLESIHVLFERALLIRGLVFVNNVLGGETVQISFHVVQ